jgi:tetratricopeptide (TPR) repeat protein
VDAGRDIEELDAQELNELGNAYSAHGMFEEAIDSYLRSLAKRKSKGDLRGQAVVLNNLGAVYYQQGRFPEAMECYQASLEIARDQGEEATELAALMNLVFLHYTQQEYEAFRARAGDAEELALRMERWEPLVKLNWLRGRLAMDDPEGFQRGLRYYSAALSYAAREGDDELEQMLRRIDAQAERLLAQDSRGLAMVLYDYLGAFAREEALSEGVLSWFSGKREEILRRPSLS